MSQNEINQINENGDKHGLWIFYGKDQPGKGYPDNAIIKKGYYLNNRLSGLGFMYYPNEKIKLIGNYINGRPNGFYCRFDSTENVTIEGQYTKDVFNGFVISYLESGCINYKIRIDNNKSDSIIYYYDDCQADSSEGTIKIIRETDHFSYSSKKTEGKITKCFFYNESEKTIIKEPQCDIMFDSVNIEGQKKDTLEYLINKEMQQYLIHYDHYKGKSKLYNKMNGLIFKGQINNKVIHEGIWYQYDEIGQLKTIFTFTNGNLVDIECF